MSNKGTQMVIHVKATFAPGYKKRRQKSSRLEFKELDPQPQRATLGRRNLSAGFKRRRIKGIIAI